MGHVAWRLAAKKIPEYAWLSIICGQSALEWGIDSSASAYQWYSFLLALQSPSPRGGCRRRRAITAFTTTFPSKRFERCVVFRVRNVSQLNRLLKEKSEAETMSSVQANLLEALRIEKEAKERQLHFEREKFVALREARSPNSLPAQPCTAIPCRFVHLAPIILCRGALSAELN